MVIASFLVRKVFCGVSTLNNVSIFETENIFRERRLTRYLSLSLRRYATRWIRTYRTRTTREPAILNEMAGNEDDAATEIGNLLLSPELSAEDVFLLDTEVADVITDPLLYRAYVRLTENQRRVLVGLIIRGWRQEEMAAALNVSQQAIWKIKSQAINRIRSTVHTRVK